MRFEEAFIRAKAHAKRNFSSRSDVNICEDEAFWAFTFSLPPVNGEICTANPACIIFDKATGKGEMIACPSESWFVTFDWKKIQTPNLNAKDQSMYVELLNVDQDIPWNIENSVLQERYREINGRSLYIDDDKAP